MLKGSNFEDPAGSRANLEGVNLKGAVLEGSIMAGINLRVATLKNVNMQNCKLLVALSAIKNCLFETLCTPSQHRNMF